MNQTEETKAVACEGCGAEFEPALSERYCHACMHGVELVGDARRAALREIGSGPLREIVKHCREHYLTEIDRRTYDEVPVKPERLRIHEVRRYPRQLDQTTALSRTHMHIDVEYTRRGFRAMFGITRDGHAEIWQD